MFTNTLKVLEIGWSMASMVSRTSSTWSYLPMYRSPSPRDMNLIHFEVSSEVSFSNSVCKIVDVMSPLQVPTKTKCNSNTGNGRNNHLGVYVRIAADVILEQQQSRVNLVVDTGGRNTHSQKSTGSDLALFGIQVLVQSLKTLVCVPEVDQTQRCGGQKHSFSLGSVYPLLVADQLLCSVTGVGKCTNESCGQVLFGTLQSRSVAKCGVLKVSLVNVIRNLRLQQVELTNKVFVVLAQLDVGNTLLNGLVVDLETGVLSSKHESQLFLH
ncbi:hypothetical protein OGAPHI_005798 [Ogataea philodendri]|uniref:Uncharacterized protein n=1 Tax=Ogataea philodendri TaxID=1378263 RepID=A0A9P8P0A5_9ASCO|nr:uncharacterized protein OGAPHI_005798 [Ogataea philodendri]KAH3662546.1 hypothetical protein OGAPHI_005798 [Ogataea philodendri]